MDYRTYFRDYPDKNGRFGEYGGAILPPQLVPVFEEITGAYTSICHSARFINAHDVADFKLMIGQRRQLFAAQVVEVKILPARAF